MKQKIKAFAKQYGMLPDGALVLVAVSGGMDSMCLLHCLHTQGVRVAAAHFNHQLRAAEADGDEAFVRRWCESRGIAFYAGRCDVAALAAENGWTVEEAGRRARYEFLERTAEQIGADRIATAHHAQDNAETILFHLVRGTGPDGLGAIAPVRGKLIRPMLTVTREQIGRYAGENDVPYRTDSTNADTAYTRNYLRCEVLPLLEQVNAAASLHMSNTALRQREESAYLDELAAGLLREKKQTPDAVALPCQAVRDAPSSARQSAGGKEGLYRGAYRQSRCAVHGKRGCAARPAARRACAAAQRTAGADDPGRQSARTGAAADRRTDRLGGIYDHRPKCGKKPRFCRQHLLPAL